MVRLLGSASLGSTHLRDQEGGSEVVKLLESLGG